MSQRLSLIIALFILVTAGVYFWWRGQAENQVNRQIDRFIETVEYRKLSLTQPSKRHAAFRELLSSTVIVDVPSPAPSGQYSRDEMIDQLDRFHSYISYFEIQESSRSIAIDDTSAEVKILGTFQVAHGPKTRTNVNGILELLFEKEDDWKISGIKITEN